MDIIHGIGIGLYKITIILYLDGLDNPVKTVEYKLNRSYIVHSLYIFDI